MWNNGKKRYCSVRFLFAFLFRRMLRNCCGGMKAKNERRQKSTSLLNFRPLLILHSYKWRLIELKNDEKYPFILCTEGQVDSMASLKNDRFPSLLGLIKKLSLIIHHTTKSIKKTKTGKSAPRRVILLRKKLFFLMR